jgi:ketosteroid isomerase-like protein
VAANQPSSQNRWSIAIEVTAGEMHAAKPETAIRPDAEMVVECATQRALGHPKRNAGIDEIQRPGDMMVLRTDEFVDGGDCVVVFGETSGTYRATARSFRSHFAHEWRLRDSRLTLWRGYVDPAWRRRRRRVERKHRTARTEPENTAARRMGLRMARRWRFAARPNGAGELARKPHHIDLGMDLVVSPRCELQPSPGSAPLPRRADGVEREARGLRHRTRTRLGKLRRRALCHCTALMARPST